MAFTPCGDSCNKENDDNNIYVAKDYALDLMDDAVVFSTHAYKNIFGCNRGKTNKQQKLLSVVSITNADNGKKIRRRYVGSQIKGVDENSLVLTPSSIRLLCEKDNSELVGKKVVIKAGKCWDTIKYYWDHPFHATRISYKVGLPALILSIVAFLFSIFTQIVCK